MVAEQLTDKKCDSIKNKYWTSELKEVTLLKYTQLQVKLLELE